MELTQPELLDPELWSPASISFELAMVLLSALLMGALAWWRRRLLDVARRARSSWRRYRRRRRTPNVWHRSGLVVPLVNQHEVVERCLTAVSRARGDVVVVTGNSGSGKTSVLRRVADAVVADGCTVLWLDLRDAPEAITAYAELMHQLADAGADVTALERTLDRRGAPVQAEARTGSDPHPPSTALASPGSMVQPMAADGRWFTSPENELRHALQRVWPSLPRRRHVVLVVDGDGRADEWPGWVPSVVDALPATGTTLVGARATPSWVGRDIRFTEAPVAELNGTHREQLARTLLAARDEHAPTDDAVDGVLTATASDTAPYALVWAVELAVTEQLRGVDLAVAAGTRAAAQILDALPDRAARAYRSLSVLPWFDGELATAVCDLPAHDVEELLDRSFIETTAHGRRFHARAREHLRSTLRAQDPAQELRSHARAAAVLAERLPADTAPADTSWSPRERATIAAYAHATIRSAPDARERIGPWLRAAIDRLDGALAREITDDCIDALGSDDHWAGAWRAELAWLGGDVPGAEAALAALDLDGEVGGDAVAAALLVRGCVALKHGDADAACTDLERARDAYAGLGERTRVAHVVEQLAKVERARGNLARALEYHYSAVGQLRTTDDVSSLTSALGSYGTTTLLAGDTPAALLRLDESVALARTHPLERFLMSGLRSRAGARVLAGDPDGALADAREARELAVEAEMPVDAAAADLYSAEALTQLLRLASANEHATRALDPLQQAGARLDLANAWAAYALIRTLLGDSVAALDALDRGDELAQDTGFEYGSCWLLLRRATVHRLTGGDDSELRPLLDECVERATRNGAAGLRRRARAELRWLAADPEAPGRPFVPSPEEIGHAPPGTVALERIALIGLTTPMTPATAALLAAALTEPSLTPFDRQDLHRRVGVRLQRTGIDAEAAIRTLTDAASGVNTDLLMHPGQPWHPDGPQLQEERR